MAINLQVALEAFKSAGIDPLSDFHTLRSDQVEVVLSVAKTSGYRHPRNANGSKARYFFYAIQRKAIVLHIPNN